MSCLEWTVFVCTHTLGHQWKAEFGAAPHWVKTVMDNGRCRVRDISDNLTSDPCRVLHSCRCVHCCRPACSAAILVLPPAPP